MTRTAARCPNCSAPIAFAWSSSVQTVCAHCRSILVRHDVDLARVGEVSDLPPDPSPIRIGTAGRYRDRAFTVIGRILYEYEDGYWNEWHLLFEPTESGWLSDAQLEFAISRPASSALTLPPSGTLRPGLELHLLGNAFTVATRTVARYRGVEGELPFESWQRHDVLFVDLRSHDRRFVTVDYADDPPTVYLGELVEFDDLHLRHLRTFDGWPTPD